MNVQELLSPDALEKVLAKEVEEITDEELDSMIRHYRAQREKFLLDEAAGKKPSRSSAPKAPSASAQKKAELAKSIEDLIGDL